MKTHQDEPAAAAQAPPVAPATDTDANVIESADTMPPQEEGSAAGAASPASSETNSEHADEDEVAETPAQARDNPDDDVDALVPGMANVYLVNRTLGIHPVNPLSHQPHTGLILVGNAIYNNIRNVEAYIKGVRRDDPTKICTVLHN
jgi:hypothetical protein